MSHRRGIGKLVVSWEYLKKASEIEDMLGPTHRVVTLGFVLVCNMLLYTIKISHIDYYLSMIIMILVGRAGTKFPDVDNTWEYVKDKTIINWIINKLIHLTGGKHRSWQTHSLDIATISLLAGFYVPKVLNKKELISELNMELMIVVFFGFNVGWVSHLIADMLNGVGVRLVCWKRKRVAFVPSRIGKTYFRTGATWERYVYTWSKFINIGLGVIALVYPFVFDKFVADLINQVGVYLRGIIS